MSTMKRFLLAAVLAGLLFGCAGPGPNNGTSIPAPKPAPGVFFVATNGNDEWSGHLPRPSRKGSDGPFATLPRALKAVREAKQQGANESRQPATVFLCGGNYFVEAPIVLTPEDSYLLLTACPGTTPVLSGGRPITGWKEVVVEGKKLWAADVPGVRDGFDFEFFLHGHVLVFASDSAKSFAMRTSSCRKK